MRSILEKILALLAGKVIKKYNPQIVGVTGSVGKTSTREAVFSVVSQKYRTRQSPKNFNELIGLPLTILGFTNYPGSSVFSWMKILFSGVGLLFFKNKYPEVLVLEMGIDRPGEMERLVSTAPPHIAVLTSVGLSHYEFFKDITTVADEKIKIASQLKPDQVFIFNADNSEIVARSTGVRGQKVGVSIMGSSEALVLVSEITEELTDKAQTVFTVKTPRKEYKLTTRAVGTTHVSALAFAVAVAEELKIEADLIVAGALQYKPFPGRLSLIAGIKHSIIIDDTYNAAPDSVRQALMLLSRMPQGEKMAVLGDMLELGSVSDSEHEKIGEQVAKMKISRLVTVGPGGKIIAAAAVAAGLPAEKVVSFNTSDEARLPVQDMLVPEMAVLIKGSQGVRMEKITKEVMAEPMRAKDLLCRQYGHWLDDV